MSLPQLKFSYFGLPGRGEPCRLAMLIGDVPFEDDRLGRSEFAAIRSSLPLQSVPVLYVTPVGSEKTLTICQSNAILRYVGKLGKLYPSDPIQAVYVDEVIDTTIDFFQTLFKYNGDDKDELRKTRETALKDSAQRYWGGCEQIIKKIPTSEEGPYVLGKQISIADCVIAGFYNLFATAFLDFVPKDALSEFERMVKIHKAVMERPEIKQYYEEHPIVPVK